WHVSPLTQIRLLASIFGSCLGQKRAPSARRRCPPHLPRAGAFLLRYGCAAACSWAEGRIDWRETIARLHFAARRPPTRFASAGAVQQAVYEAYYRHHSAEQAGGCETG